MRNAPIHLLASLTHTCYNLSRRLERLSHELYRKCPRRA